MYTWSVPPSDQADARVRAAETKRRRTRERLLHAAVHVMEERGLEAKVNDIAEYAGVSVPTFYNMYTSRNHLCMDAFWVVLNDDFLSEMYEEAHVERLAFKLENYIPMLQKQFGKYKWLLKAALIGRIGIPRDDSYNSKHASEMRFTSIGWATSTPASSEGFPPGYDFVDLVADWFKIELVIEGVVEEDVTSTDTAFGLALHSLSLDFLEDVATGRHVDANLLGTAFRDVAAARRQRISRSRQP